MKQLTALAALVLAIAASASASACGSSPARSATPAASTPAPAPSSRASAASPAPAVALSPDPLDPTKLNPVTLIELAGFMPRQFPVSTPPDGSWMGEPWLTGGVSALTAQGFFNIEDPPAGEEIQAWTFSSRADLETYVADSYTLPEPWTLDIIGFGQDHWFWIELNGMVMPPAWGGVHGPLPEVAAQRVGGTICAQLASPALACQGW